MSSTSVRRIDELTAHRFKPRGRVPEVDHEKRGLCIAASLTPKSLKEMRFGARLFLQATGRPLGRSSERRRWGRFPPSRGRPAAPLFTSSTG